MRAALYCRVSSAIQAKEGDSISAQLDALNKYANERKYQIIGTFVDDGISGTKYDRDEFQKMLDLVRQDKVDVILCTKLDRIHRSLRNFLNMQDILDQHHCNWIAIWEPMYDTTTPQGRMIVNTMMNLAQFEAEQTGERVRQVQAHKLRQREVISGTTPHGYSIVNKHLVPNEDADDVRKAFEIYDKTGNLSKTAEAMAGTNLPTTVTGMKRLLKNRRYIGEAHGMTDFCEPIVDKEAFERVQVALSRNIKHNQKRTYLFSGLIRCAECGASMSGHYWIGRDCLGYRCQKHYCTRVNRCENGKVITDGVIEKKLLDMLPNVIIEQVEIHKKKSAPAVNYERQKNALEKKIERLKILFVNEEISLEEYRVDKATLMKQIEQLVPVKPPEPPQAVLQLQGMDIKGIYEILTQEERRMFWRGIIKEIRFDKDRNLFFEFL